MKTNRFSQGECILLIGVIALFVSVLVGMILPVLSKPRDHCRRATCGGNLKQMGLAMLGYSGDYSGFFPITPSGTNFELLDEYHTNELPNSKVYNCPKSSKPKTCLASKSDYWYIGSGLRDDNSDSTTTRLAFDQSGNHPKNEWMNVLFIDGHVQGAIPDSSLGWNDNDPRFIFEYPQGRPVPKQGGE
jgi:prepilin-type processing-associated H-X9-DG protein